MSDSSFGYVKLYHPKGPLVSLPVPMDPKEAFDHIGRCFEAGWLLAAPGLEEGEHKEDIGYILRGSSEHDGEVTPYLLFYTTNEGMTFSFLKVYFNDEESISRFERVSGLKMSSIPEYAGTDKPERGKSAKTDAYIVKLKKPIPVVWKQNPKYKESDKEEAEKAKKVYKTPKRVFVRWGDDAEKPKDAPVSALDTIVGAWKALLTVEKIPNVVELNKQLAAVKAIEIEEARRTVWGMVKNFAAQVDCVFDETAKQFVVKPVKMIRE